TRARSATSGRSGTSIVKRGPVGTAASGEGTGETLARRRRSGRGDGLLEGAGSGDVPGELLAVDEHRWGALRAREGLGLDDLLDPGQVGALGNAVRDVEAGGVRYQAGQLLVAQTGRVGLLLEQGGLRRGPLRRVLRVGAHRRVRRAPGVPRRAGARIEHRA